MKEIVYHETQIRLQTPLKHSNQRQAVVIDVTHNLLYYMYSILKQFLLKPLHKKLYHTVKNNCSKFCCDHCKFVSYPFLCQPSHFVCCVVFALYDIVKYEQKMFHYFITNIFYYYCYQMNIISQCVLIN